tara:strand:+ start:1081 stop:1485 length:405 start_codon:yes stop_codon:yes gene_type:complete
MSDKQPDWDKITEGKIRHGIAVEAFSKGMELNADNMKNIEKWVQFVIHGYDGIKNIVDDSKKDDLPKGDESILFPEKKDIGETFDVIIRKNAESLNATDKAKVIKALDDGKITADNLQVSLDRISQMIAKYGDL